MQKIRLEAYRDGWYDCAAIACGIKTKTTGNLEIIEFVDTAGLMGHRKKYEKLFLKSIMPVRKNQKLKTGISKICKSCKNKNKLVFCSLGINMYQKKKYCRFWEQKKRRKPWGN